MQSYVVRVWLPDRPGALGQVASRIGAVRGDVVAIEILERGGGSAIDELVVDLADETTLELLVSEIKQVDGVAVEHVRAVGSDRREIGMAALDLVACLAESAPADRLARCCSGLLELMEAEWAAVVRLTDTTVEVQVGSCPDVAWLTAFLAGSRHLDAEQHTTNGPGDLAWTHLPGRDVALAVGRHGRPFHARERQQVDAIGRIIAALLP